MRQISKEQKEQQGTYEPSKEGFEAVSWDAYEKAPNVPDTWPLEAQIVWRDICAVLKSGGHLTKATVFTVRRLAWAFYRTLIAEERLLSLPGDKDWEKIMDTNTKTVERICAKYGFTPADLPKVPVMKKEQSTLSLLK
jgi:hypothetical protein